MINSKINPYLGWSLVSQRYDHLYTNRHLYNGIIDAIGRRNLDSLFVGLRYDINEKWDLDFKWMNFKQNKSGMGAYTQALSSQINGDLSQDNIGNEFDLMISYKKNDFENFTLGASVLTHGDYFQNSPDPSSLIYLDYLVQF